MNDKEKQIVEITKKAVRKDTDNTGSMVDLLNQEINEILNNEKLEQLIHELKIAMCSYESCEDCPTSWCYTEECATMAIYKGYRKIDKDKEVVISKEEYELLTNDLDKGDYGDFERGYSQAHKEMLKDCIESNKKAEQIGYEKGSKETAEKIIKHLLNFIENETFHVGYELNKVERELNKIAKQLIGEEK